jgi:hypothetical protein
VKVDLATIETPPEFLQISAEEPSGRIQDTGADSFERQGSDDVARLCKDPFPLTREGAGIRTGAAEIERGDLIPRVSPGPGSLAEDQLGVQARIFPARRLQQGS